jgi:putative exporter of polyketide antibiotics
MKINRAALHETHKYERNRYRRERNRLVFWTVMLIVFFAALTILSTPKENHNDDAAVPANLGTH